MINFIDAFVSIKFLNQPKRTKKGGQLCRKKSIGERWVRESESILTIEY